MRDTEVQTIHILWKPGLLHLLGFKEAEDRKAYKASFICSSLMGCCICVSNTGNFFILDYKDFNTLSFSFFMNR